MKGDINSKVILVEYPQIDSMAELTNDDIKGFIKFHLNNGRKKYEIDKDFYIGTNDRTIFTHDGDNPNNPNNRITTPWARKMTQTVKGYMYKPGLIRYIDADQTTLFEAVKELYEINKEDCENAELGEQQSKYGIGIELLYLKDVKGKMIPTFKYAEPEDIVLIFDNTIDKNLIGVIRYYMVGTVEMQNDKGETEIVDEYRVELYSKAGIIYYEFMDNEEGVLNEKGQAENVFSDIPFILYPNNHEYISDPQPVKNLILLCDKMYSDSANELDRFAAAYLVLTNYILGGNSEEVKAKLQIIKDVRIFNIDSEGKVEFLTKDIPVEFFREVRAMLWKDIQSFSCIPNFRDESFGTASGIAILYKLVDFEFLASDKEALFRNGLERRLDLIIDYLGIINTTQEEPDIKITFSRNLPHDLKEKADIVTKLIDIVPDEILLGLLPFIEDVDAALEAIAEQKKKNMENMIDLDEEVDDEPETETDGVEDDKPETEEDE